MDVRNLRYNPAGSIEATAFTFPYQRRTFDLAIAISLFTHLLSRDVDHYIEQVSHVLKPSGRFLFTAFLLNEDSAERIRAGLSTFPFRFEVEHGLVAEEHNPEGAVCLSESFIKTTLDRHAIAIDHVHYGAWCGRNPSLSYQDLIVARKLSRTALLRRKTRRKLIRAR